MTDNHNTLCVEGLSVDLLDRGRALPVVQNVGFSIAPAETFALVGESGCGKTTTALAIMRLLRSDQAAITSGRILLQGQDLLSLTNRQMQRIRGRTIAMAFQEPAACLNPIQTVGAQIAECISLHRRTSRRQAWTEAVALLDRVGIPNPRLRANAHLHELSGGMCQRAMIALAISGDPALLIADEPTAFLDAPLRAEILALLDTLRQRSRMSILLITHDLPAVALHAARTAVMYASRIVEVAPTQQLLDHPAHPYTAALLKCVPKSGGPRKRLEATPGAVPHPSGYPPGCKFHPRCPIGRNDDKCRTTEPHLRPIAPNHHVACWHTP